MNVVEIPLFDLRAGTGQVEIPWAEVTPTSVYVSPSPWKTASLTLPYDAPSLIAPPSQRRKIFEYVPHWLYIIWSGIYTDMVRYRGRVGAARRIHLEGYPPGVRGGEGPTVEEQIAIDGLLPHGQESRLDDFPAWLLDLIDQYTPQPPAEYPGPVRLLNQRKETK